ncbi:MAG: metal dependent phosphohydrolase, partial [Halothiobacillaceae bacterium]
MSPNSSNAPHRKSAIPDISRLAPLSTSVTEALALVNSPKTDLRHLALSLGKDPVLSAQLLRIANSPFYGMSGRIATIKEACVVLGSHTIQGMLLAVGAMERFPVSQQRVLDRNRAWRHSLLVAATARLVATTTHQECDTAFSAGLLHDLGSFVLDEIAPERLCQLPPTLDEEETLLNLEWNHGGFDHATLGATLARQWHLPLPICDAIAAHHQPVVDRSQPGLDD